MAVAKWRFLVFIFIFQFLIFNFFPSPFCVIVGMSEISVQNGQITINGLSMTNVSLPPNY